MLPSLYKTLALSLHSKRTSSEVYLGAVQKCHIFIDREAREIMYLVVSVRPSVRYHSPGLIAKSNNHHYQSKVIVCVSVISRRMRIIARMQSIGF